MKKLHLLLFAFGVAVLSGCKTINQDYMIEYKPQTFDRQGVGQGESLFVAEIIDERSKNEKIPFDQNSPWILIPLWPYNYDEVNPVITYSYFQAGLADSLSRLIANDLSASELFCELQVAQPDDTPPFKADKNAYQLVFTLKQAVWKRYLTSYGLSYLGAYLWFFFPKSYGSVALKMEITLKEPKTNKVVARKTFEAEEPTTEWIYGQMNYHPPISEFALEAIFPKFMKTVRVMLLEALKQAEKK